MNKKFQPKEFQRECVYQVLRKIENGNKRISVLIPTGCGKLLISAMIADKIKLLNQKVMLLTTFNILKQQSIDVMEEYHINNITCDTVEHFLLESGYYECVILLDVSPYWREKIKKHFESDSETIIISLGEPLYDAHDEWDVKNTSVIDINKKATVRSEVVDFYLRMGEIHPFVYTTSSLIDVRDIFTADTAEKSKIIEQVEKDKEQLICDVSNLNIALQENLDKSDEDTLKAVIIQLQRKMAYQEQLLMSVGIPKDLVDKEFMKLEKKRAELEPNFYDDNKRIVESVIAQFEAFVAESVSKLTRKVITLENEKRYEDILIELLSENIWKKLSGESKGFLISAKITYDFIINYDKEYEVDYSSVCLLITKALDVELTRRLYDKYIEYLKLNYVIDKWPISILNKNGTACLEKYKFTLGTIKYVIGCDAWGNVKNIYVYNVFKNFASTELYRINLSQDEIEQRIKNLVKYVEKVRIDYRNPAAHRNNLDAISAKECMEYMIETYKKLKEILEDMKF